MSNLIQPGQKGAAPFDRLMETAIAITDTELAAIHDARAALSIVLAFEDRFAMVIDNLMDLERRLFDWALSGMMRPVETFHRLFDYKRDAERRLGNLLSTCRQYIDQTHRLVQPLLADQPTSTTKAFSTAYEASLAYRVMEALRNMAQHKEAGINSVTFHAGWLKGPGEKARRYGVSLALDLDHLKAGEFKAKTLNELAELDEMPDLKRMIREYVSGLSDVHDRIRKALKAKVKAWSASVQAPHDRLQQLLPGADLGTLAVFEQQADGRRFILEQLTTEPLERLADIQRKNQTNLNLGPAYATSAAMTKPETPS